MAHVTDWTRALELEREPFFALMFAAIRKADSVNFSRFRELWPKLVAEAEERYNSPGGVLPGEVSNAR